MTKLAFIGAGSTIFMKNIVGDMLHFEALRDARIVLMDIDRTRLDESRMVAEKMIATMGTGASVEATTDRARALEGADFVVTAFQIGGYRPSTVIDFDIPKKFGLRQTIADTLGVGGIMRGLRTVPHLWAVAEDMERLCPDALLLQYVNPMAINTWALAERFPRLKQAGLCHSVQNTVEEIAHDLDLPAHEIRYRVAGVNHVAFFLRLEHQGRDLYPALREGYRAGRLPKPPLLMPRCWNKVRYEAMDHLGYFCTESSEHFAEYVPWFIKEGRDDLIEDFRIPLDEYPLRCVEQAEGWAEQARALKQASGIDVKKSHEFAAEMMNAVVTDTPYVAYANLPNRGQVPQLPLGAAVETPALVDANGCQPSVVTGIPPQLVALMRTQINVQELVVRALVEENVDHLYHAAYMDPHTAAELDLRQIRGLVSDLLAAHGDMIPDFARPREGSMTTDPTFPDLDGASVFITGGGSGIGAVLTEAFLRQGAKVAFVQRSDASAFVEEMEGKTGVRPLFLPCDITDIPALQDSIGKAAKAHGPVRVLVNNAANDKRHKTEDVTEDFWDWSQAINLKAYFFACQAVVAGMRASGGGSIVNFSSISYIMGNAGYPAYTSANGAITAMTRSLAREFGPDRIRVNALLPGWVLTQKQLDMWASPEDLDEHMKKMCLKQHLRPEDITGGTLFLASGASRMMTGQALVIDGGVVVTG